MAEEWEDIDGFPGYKVSNEGRVCSVKKDKTIMLRGGKSSNGYLQVVLRDKHKKTYGKTIHRLVGVHLYKTLTTNQKLTIEMVARLTTIPII
ncbi:MAG: NUMOD4 domain-containing protein [Clostridia bacterium]|jgi:gamma-glutamylcysteine synthetase|nr:NUMOD4 domain-containing protein [Clostridia bacterium]